MRTLQVAERLHPKPAGLMEVPMLEHAPELSCGANSMGNALIQGENLAALRVLAPAFEAQVRCVYIDPPYNNNERYTHYRDDLDHATWLREIKARLEILSRFLRDDGSIWISIDDREVHYLKVHADAIFQRENFVSTIVWQQRTTRENRRVFSNDHEYILVYAKNASAFKRTRNLLSLTPEITSRYKNPDDDPRGPWQSVSANVQAGHATSSQFYEIMAPTGRCHVPPKGRCWVYNQKKMEQLIADGRVWFGRTGTGVPRLKRYLRVAKPGLTPETLWTAASAGTNLDAKKHLLSLFPDQAVFDTPKPESLIHRILQIATNPGDIVLDAYLGSGTTAAVSHKMGRRYVGIEAGNHSVTHCAERLRQVVAGEPGGISKTVGWSGGGGFDFFRLK